MKNSAPVFSLIYAAILLTQSAYAADTVYKYKHKISTLAVKDSSTPTDPSGPTPAPKILLSSTGPLNFDNTDVGQTSASRSILVLNDGTANYLFSSNLLASGPNPGDFTVNSNCLNANLTPSASCTISFEFKPTSQGAKSAMLDLSAVVPSTAIQLSGVGFQYAVDLSVNALSSFSTAVGTLSSQSDPVYLTNTGNKPAMLTSYSVTGPFVLGSASSGCSVSELLSGAKNLSTSTCIFTFKYAPQVEGSNQTGLVSFQTSAGIKTLSLSGSTVSKQVALSATSLAYIGVPIGSFIDKALTVSNTSQSPVTINPSISEGSSDYSVVTGGAYANMCSTSVSVGQTCQIYVKFSPSSSGNRTGKLILGSNGTNEPLSVSLVGTGLVYTAALSANTDADFGAVTVGQSANKSFTFTNTGNTVLSGIYPELVNSTGLSIVSNTCGTQASPVSFGPGNTCTVQVQFAPQSVYTLNGTKLVVNSNATSAPTSISLTGSSIASNIVFSDTGPLVFDSTDVGSSSSPKSIVVLNDGTAGYNFSSNLLSSGLNPSDFLISSDCLNTVIAPLNTCTIAITFKPTLQGNRTSQLDLSAIVPSTVVQLSGVGLQYGVSLSTNSITGLTSPVGSTSALSNVVTLTNTGNKPSSLSSFAISGPFVLGTASAGCSAAELVGSPKNLAASQCSFTFKFAPQVAGQNQAGSVSFQTSAGVKTLSLSGSTTTREATLSATSLAYVGTAVGSSGDKAITISNNSQESLTLNPQITAGSSDYSVVPVGQYANTCSTSLAPGQTCLLYVKFAPTASGNRVGSLSLGSNGTNEPLTVQLSGTGLVYTSTFTPATDSDFGVVNVGQSISKSFTFTNTGNTVLSGISAELINGTGLSITSNTCGTQASPVSFGPGNTCTVQVQFAPQSAYSLSGAKINVNSNATASPNSISLTGSAVNSDPNYANVVLFMNMNGTVGSTIASNADATGKTVTATGSTATYSNTAVFGQSANFTTQSVGGGGGCNPAPTTSLEVARNANFEMNTTDYTVELRVRPTTLSGYQGLLSNYESCSGTIRGWALYFSGTKLLLNHSNAGADKNTTFATTFVNSNWYHIALVKTGSSISLYVNGVKDSVIATSGSQLSTSAVNLRIGSIHTIAASGFIGQMDEVRMTRNVARYTANFTPNSTALTYP